LDRNVTTIRKYTEVLLDASKEVGIDISADKRNIFFARVQWKTTVLKCFCDLKNGVFSDVTPCGSCKNRHFGGVTAVKTSNLTFCDLVHSLLSSYGLS
jgi:hypothetical protein